MVTGVCENQFAAARKLLILQRRDAGAVDQARLESVRFQCGGRAYEPAKVGSSRGKARWRKGPAAPTASDVLRGRSRREGHRSVSLPRSSNRTWTISVIRLSDEFHATACAAAGARTSAATRHPQFPNDHRHGKPQMARPGNLVPARRRKRRRVWYRWSPTSCRAFVTVP